MFRGINQFQRVSYVTGLHNRRQLFSSFCPHLLLVLLFFQAVFRLPSFVRLSFDLTFPYSLCVEVYAMIKKL
jgi:hypothetical protein